MNASQIVFSLLISCSNYGQARSRGFKAAKSIIDEPGQPFISQVTFLPIIQVLYSYAIFADLPDSTRLSLEAVQYIFKLFELIPSIQTRVIDDDLDDKDDPNVFWSIVLTPILKTFIKLCRDMRHDVRQFAITLLQRSLLHRIVSTRLKKDPFLIHLCFKEIIFGVMDELIKPFEDVPSDASSIGIDESRVRCITGILSQIFLHYLSEVVLLPDFGELWFSILTYIETFLRADRTGVLAEAVPEAIKNIVLVMFTHKVQFLLDPEMWATTWNRINSFCPELQKDQGFLSSLQAMGDKGPIAVGQVKNTADIGH